MAHLRPDTARIRRRRSGTRDTGDPGCTLRRASGARHTRRRCSRRPRPGRCASHRRRSRGRPRPRKSRRRSCPTRSRSHRGKRPSLASAQADSRSQCTPRSRRTRSGVRHIPLASRGCTPEVRRARRHHRCIRDPRTCTSAVRHKPRPRRLELRTHIQPARSRGARRTWLRAAPARTSPWRPPGRGGNVRRARERTPREDFGGCAGPRLGGTSESAPPARPRSAGSASTGSQRRCPGTPPRS